MAKFDVTADFLREIIDYCPETGVFRWRKARRGTRVGAIAGSPSSDGGVKISVKNESHQAHRLAWLYVNGEWPSRQVGHINGDPLDHKNRDPSDNRIANLREADVHQNGFNHGGRNARSGIKGVSLCPQTRRWKAQIKAYGRQVDLGRFDTKEEAAEAYRAAAIKMHGEFAFTGR